MIKEHIDHDCQHLLSSFYMSYIYWPLPASQSLIRYYDYLHLKMTEVRRMSTKSKVRFDWDLCLICFIFMFSHWDTGVTTVPGHSLFVVAKAPWLLLIRFVTFVWILCYQTFRRCISAFQGCIPLCFRNCERDIQMTTKRGYSFWINWWVDCISQPSLHLTGAMWQVLNIMFKDTGFCKAGRMQRCCNRSAGIYHL